jgi:hypothetical protein
MNIALSALIVVLFLLPAFFFRIGLSIIINRKKGPVTPEDLHDDLLHRSVTKAFSQLNFTETVFLLSIVPIILHLISLGFLHWTGSSIDYGLLLNIFSGKDDIIDPQDIQASKVFEPKMTGEKIAVPITGDPIFNTEEPAITEPEITNTSSPTPDVDIPPQD